MTPTRWMKAEQEKLLQEWQTRVARKVAQTVEEATPFSPVTDWLRTAASLAANIDDYFIKIEIEATGVVVVAKSGDDYETRGVSWEALDALKINPFPEIIAEVEKRLAARAVMERAERMVGHG